MEIEPYPPVVMKKLRNVMRVIFFMLRKGICKSKIILDLHLIMMKRSKIAGKAIGNLIEFHHSSALSCQTIDIANSYISTRDYEFSCSNSPAPAAAFNPFNKLRKNHGHNFFPKSYRYDDFSTVTAAVQRVLEASPLLPEFGKSPIVRQLRVTDSPFSLRDEGDGDSQFVDKAAEEFIEKFYRDLRMEKKNFASFESPYRNTLCR